MIVPDKITPEIGWRVWRPWGASARITGPADLSFKSWTPLEKQTAECKFWSGHHAPDPLCECGFHAAKSLELLVNNYLRPIMAGYGVVGEVALWGRVIEGDWGYRAEFAYPVSFYLADSIPTISGPARIGQLGGFWSDDVLRRFGVPVVRVRSLDDIPTAERIAA